MHYGQVRQFSERLCHPLEVEDYGLQSMPDVSPPKWHLAHTSWFFEAFLLQPFLPRYEVFHPKFSFLFNSYYESLGARHPRPQRGLISRPTVQAIYQYRAYVDQAMETLITAQGDRPEVKSLLTLGLHHEQQHQELLLMDIKYNFSINPLYPAYHSTTQNSPKAAIASTQNTPSLQSLEFSHGIHEIGHGTKDFCFDNELPRHPVLLRDGALDPHLITNGDYLEFIEAGGYQNSEYWLSEGWHLVQTEQWQAPLYWTQQSEQRLVITLMGLQPLVLEDPVCHVSYYEADAFARWKGKSLPTESEWEVVAQTHRIEGQFADSGYFHPQVTHQSPQLYGSVWEWTQSPYINYPGFQIADGAVGEYNGKFMSNQMVLRGGCCVTPEGHIRSSYRNFFPPHARWQFSGLRLCTHAS